MLLSTKSPIIGNREREAKVIRFSHAGISILQGGSNMTGTDLCVNKPHCAAAVRP